MADTPSRAELLVAAGLDALIGHAHGECDTIEEAADLLLSSADSICDPKVSDEAFAKLVARARSLLGDEWRPIGDKPDLNVAPWNGRTVLLWGRYMAEPCTGAWGSLRWGTGWRAMHDGLSVIESQHDLSGTDYKTVDVPTHWRPLPPSPQDGDTE